MRVSDQVKENEVVDYSGTRIGTINDVIINCEGRIVGYNLSEILADSPAVVGGRIPVEYSRSLGPDILLVYTTHGSRVGEAALTTISGAGEVEADLLRTGGVGKGYARLLEAAGVDTVPELVGLSGVPVAVLEADCVAHHSEQLSWYRIIAIPLQFGLNSFGCCPAMRSPTASHVLRRCPAAGSMR